MEWYFNFTLEILQVKCAEHFDIMHHFGQKVTWYTRQRHSWHCVVFVNGKKNIKNRVKIILIKLPACCGNFDISFRARYVLNCEISRIKRWIFLKLVELELHVLPCVSHSYETSRSIKWQIPSVNFRPDVLHMRNPNGISLCVSSLSCIKINILLYIVYFAYASSWCHNISKNSRTLFHFASIPLIWILNDRHIVGCARKICKSEVCEIGLLLLVGF